MFEKFTAVDAGNFKQRYLGTFGYFTANGKRTLVKLSTISSETRDKYVEFLDKDNSIYKVVSDAQGDDVGFHFLPPKSAWYNRKNGIPILVTRIASKQYLRGICDKNTAIVDLRGQRYDVGFETLESIFDIKITPKEAVDHAAQLVNTASGFAVSPQFVVGLTTETIKCFNQSIGNCIRTADGFKVKLLKPDMWRTEVIDAFRRADIKVEVAQ